jgi:23S rRNA (pseudouridine1915-N3)-methyltransferase
MKVTIISVGKAHDTSLKDAILEYTKRTYTTLSTEWQLIPTSKIDTEAKAILATLKKDDYVILLDEEGSAVSSISLAELIAEKMNDGTRRIVFIIGGAYGVNDEVKKRANYIWQLSKLVFPHMLVRLILIEQLYRSVSILQGGKYHHE